MTIEECIQKGAVYWRGDQLVCSPYDDEDMIDFDTQHDVDWDDLAQEYSLWPGSLKCFPQAKYLMWK